MPVPGMNNRFEPVAEIPFPFTRECPKTTFWPKEETAFFTILAQPTLIKLSCYKITKCLLLAGKYLYKLTHCLNCKFLVRLVAMDKF